jgi:hypothetical protein
MSSLIYITEETQVLIATDTLAVSAAGEPVLFTTKAFPVPHLRMVIAGTGSAGFLDQWFLFINTRMLVRGIDHLNKFAPIRLPELWACWWKQQNAKPNTTTTVYHFGCSENTGLVHSFAYRSESAFQPDPIGYGTGAKPDCTLTGLDIQRVMDDPSQIRKMMEEQRDVQWALPQEERLHIGGEIQFHYLTSDGYSVFTTDRFDDFEEHARAIYKT